MRPYLLNQPLVDPHFVRIPRLTSFTTRGLPRRDFQALCRQADRALDTQVLGFGTFDQLLADLLQGLDFAGSEGDADLVDFLSIQSAINWMLRGKYAAGILTGPSP